MAKSTMPRGGANRWLTDTMIAEITAAIDRGDTRAPWERSWVHHGVLPRNPLSGTVYRGINTVLLGMVPSELPYFATWRQVASAGGKVRDDAKYFPVWYWSWPDRSQSDDDTDDDTGYRAPWVKYYRVYNAADIDGVQWPALPPLAVAGASENARCESIVAGYDNGPTIQHGGNRAYYSPSTDVVQMPAKRQFDGTGAYYSVLYHELAHSTGHESRLDRLKSGDNLAVFGAEEYSKEELTAELAACILRNLAGIETPTEHARSKSYLQSWVSALDNNPKMLMQAGARAQKAVARIVGESIYASDAKPSETPAKDGSLHGPVKTIKASKGKKVSKAKTTTTKARTASKRRAA